MLVSRRHRQYLFLCVAALAFLLFIHNQSDRLDRRFRALLTMPNGSNAQELDLTKRWQPKPSATGQCRLHPVWTERPLNSVMAKRIGRAQTHCDVQPRHAFGMNQWGFGSDIHTWTQNVCFALERDSALYVSI